MESPRVESWRAQAREPTGRVLDGLGEAPAGEDGAVVYKAMAHCQRSEWLDPRCKKALTSKYELFVLYGVNPVRKTEPGC